MLSAPIKEDVLPSELGSVPLIGLRRTVSLCRLGISWRLSGIVPPMP